MIYFSCVIFVVVDKIHCLETWFIQNFQYSIFMGIASIFRETLLTIKENQTDKNVINNTKLTKCSKCWGSEILCELCNPVKGTQHWKAVFSIFGDILL